MTNHYQIADLHFTISGDNGRYFKALTEYFAEKGIETVAREKENFSNSWRLPC